MILKTNSDTQTLTPQTLTPQTLTPQNVFETLDHELSKIYTRGSKRYNSRLEAGLLFVDYLCGYIYKSSGDNYVNKMFPIHSKKIRKLIGGRNEKKMEIFDLLEECGIISINKSYQRDVEPMKYRLSDKFMSSSKNPFKARTIEDYSMYTRIMEYKTVQKENFCTAFPNLKHTIDSIYKLSIDFNMCYDEVIANISEPRKYHYANVAALKIFHQDFFYSLGNNGRLTTNFTQLAKSLRPYIIDTALESSNWHEIDICNTQPLIISLMISDSGERSSDAHHFRELCMQGLIYDYIAEKMNTDRNIIKQRFMDTLLFTRNNKRYLLTLKNIESEKNQKICEFLLKFKEMFPSVENWLFNRKAGKDENKKLALQVQNMESQLMIQHVAAELKDIGNFYTIHDCIVCNPNYIDKVESLIQKKTQELWRLDRISLHSEKIRKPSHMKMAVES